MRAALVLLTAVQIDPRELTRLRRSAPAIIMLAAGLLLRRQAPVLQKVQDHANGLPALAVCALCTPR